MLRDRFGLQQLTVSDAQELAESWRRVCRESTDNDDIDAVDRVDVLAFAMREFHCPWGAWTSQDCFEMLGKYSGLLDVREAWQLLHASKCPCSCSQDDFDKFMQQAVTRWRPRTDEF